MNLKNQFTEHLNTILHGDALKILKELSSNLVDCVVTSPPYWGLRDYGSNGQLGLESTLDEYIQKMTEVFREVRRVLKDEGTLWLNMGDGYCSQPAGNIIPSGFSQTRPSRRKHGIGTETVDLPQKQYGSLKPKDLIGQPWRLAFALQADGWYLRSDIIWAKPNPMPESVTDRPTKSHEYIFLMSKQAKYFYDAEAIKEPSSGYTKMPDGWDTDAGAHGSFHREGREKGRKIRGHERPHQGFDEKWDCITKAEQGANGRNKRSVWTVATQPFPEAHFATFPEKLIEPCIKAGCPVGGLVLDPFMGSGTVALVTLKLDRHYLGIELSTDYIKIAEKRLQKMGLFK